MLAAVWSRSIVGLAAPCRRRLTSALAASLVLVSWLISSAPAQDFPTHLVRIVVAFPAGGPTDFVARLLADKLKFLLGQSVVVENKPGANGTIGAEYRRAR
jgi:tripartite-type tricarboxylate transporter receptor subunit TctC